MVCAYPRAVCVYLAIVVTHDAWMQNDRTSLAIASLNGHRQTVEVLLAHGADVNAESKVIRGEGFERENE